MSKATWKKDILDHWHFNKCVESKRRIFQAFFNWRPTTLNLGLSFSIGPSGMDIEIGLWFHLNIVICFFVPKLHNSDSDLY